MTSLITEARSIADLFAYAREPQYKGVKSESRYLTMRDGTLIAIDVMLPADLPESAQVPAVMIMARYWRSMELRMPNPPKKAPIGPRESVPDYLIPRGYAVIAVDGRGSGASHGVSRHPWSPEELADYGEVAAWIKTQPWCSGKIGAYGISYEGATALRLAASGVEGITGVIPQEIEFDVYTDIALPGGIFNAAFIQEWNASNKRLDNNKTSSLFPRVARFFIKGVLPVDADRTSRELVNKAIQDHQANTDVYAAMTGITCRDDLFGSTGATLDEFSVFRHRAEIENSGAAIFSWGSWLDGAAAESALRTFNTFSNPQIAVIGAWKHEMTAHGSPYLKPGTKPNPVQAQQWAAMTHFFDQTLKDGESLKEKRLFYYTLGEEAWKQSDVFPLPGAQLQSWYFQSGNGLAPNLPSEPDGCDRYTVDFDASTGKTNRWHTQMAKPVIYLDRAREDRRLLTYTSAPLDRDLEITGYPVVTLHIASSEEDGAFFVYLEDVDPQGIVRYITEGQLRGIHRKLADQPSPCWTGMPHRTFTRADAAPMPRGQMVELTFGLQPTSVLIRQGHRIRIAIAGADKDTFARIPTRGTPEWQVSRSSALPSHIKLPISPR